jgi:hypothetical protein
MSDFNDRGAFHDNAFHDNDMENLLGRAGGAFPDVNIAYVQVQGRVRQAKRRRALVVSSAACSLLLAVGLLAVSRSGSSGAVQPNGRSTELGPDGSRLQPDDTISTTTQDTIDTTTEATVATTTIEDSTTVTEPVETTAVSVPNSSQAPGGGNGNGNGTHSTSPVTVAKTTHSSAPTTSAPPETDPPTTPTVGATPITQTFSGVGGSITVHLENGHLTLVSSQPTAGFSAEVRRDSGSHIEVRFQSDHHRTEARVDLHHGAMVEDFSEDGT